MQHEIFFEEPVAFDWIGENLEQICEKIFSIFIVRSSQIYSDDDTLMWLREIICYVLTYIDEGDLCNTKDLLRAELMSGIVGQEFKWDRYKNLKQADFMDDLSTINPQDLLGVGQQQDFEDA